MKDKGDFFYIMYPVPVEMAKNLPLPFFQKEAPTPTLIEDDENFMPLWYGNARFPEDETD